MPTVAARPRADKHARFLRRQLRRLDDLGAPGDWTFADACAWLSLDTRTTWGADLRAFLDAFERRLDKGAGALGERQARPCVRAYRALWALFAKHLTLLLKRKPR